VEEAPPASIPAVAAPPVPLVGKADEDGLIRAIWADPWDDLARAAHADWLEEQGNPLHAAILRAPSDKRDDLTEQLATLMRKDAPGKFELRLEVEGLIRIKVPVRTLRLKKFEQNSAAWLRKHHVAEVIPDGRMRDFSAEWLEHLRGLSFGGRPFDDWEALADSTGLAALCSLDLRGSYMQTSSKLFGGSGLNGLRGLCRLLLGQYLHPEELRALCEAPFAPHLRYLHFAGLYDSLKGMSVLVSAPALTNLVTLGLEHASDTCIKTLADATVFTSLRNLDLAGSYFTDLGLDALAGSSLLPRLRCLRIPTQYVSAAVLQLLAGALPPGCRLLLAGEIGVPQHDALAAILGDRLIVE
jgi:uncharacterized protein (TIGR02996 family)